MATSSSYNWNIDRDTLILQAFQKINVYGKLDSSIDSYDSTIGVRTLNGMLKMWSIDGIKVPKRKRGYIFPVLAQSEYKLGSASGASHCTNSYVSTTISTAEALGQTVLSLTSTTGMTAADFIGIELDDGSRQWTTIVSVDSSTQVTITASLTAAAAAGNTVITYTTKLNRPLSIINGTVLDIENNTESQLQVMSHDEYYNLPLKTSAGKPNQIFYQKSLTGSRPHYSSLYTYPVPNDVNKIITIVYQDAIQDLDGATDDIDLPQEWLYPVMFNLAVELGYEYGKYPELEKLEPKAREMYQLLKNSSSDDEPIRFSIKRR